MMRQMRQNTKWIMLATALAFVALMVFEWGMDVTGQSGGGLGQIGQVNGQAVMFEPYNMTYRSLYEQAQLTQTGPISSAQNQELENEAWSQMVTQLLIEQELRRRGIAVTDEELREAAFYAPPPSLMSAPEFQTEGSFDLQKYQTFVQSGVDPQFLLSLEAYYRDVIPRGKLMRQLTAGIHPSDAELWADWLDRTERVSVRYIGVDPAARIADSEVTVTDQEVRAYYDSHVEDFEQPAQATVRVVALPKAPTAADTAAVFDSARVLRDEILGGTPFEDVARRESADTVSGQAGGSLGTFARGSLTPAVEEAAFTAPVGELTEPIQSPLGVHLLRVAERTADSVTASHILLPMVRTDSAEFALLEQADSLEVLSETLTLDQTAGEMGLEVRTATVNAGFPFVAGVGMMTEGSDWAAEEALPGDVSPLFESPDAFYLVELIEAVPERTLPLEEARANITGILTLRKKTERAVEEARAITQALRQGRDFPSVATEHDAQTGTPDPFTRIQFVPTLGSRNAAIGTAFGLEPGEVSEPVAANSRVFVIEMIERSEPDSTAWLAQKETQRDQLIAAEQQRRMDEWLAGVREAADVVDRRDEVLQPVEEQPLTPGFGMPFGG